METSNSNDLNDQCESELMRQAKDSDDRVGRVCETRFTSRISVCVCVCHLLSCHFQCGHTSHSNESTFMLIVHLSRVLCDWWHTHTSIVQSAGVIECVTHLSIIVFFPHRCSLLFLFMFVNLCVWFAVTSPTCLVNANLVDSRLLSREYKSTLMLWLIITQTLTTEVCACVIAHITNIALCRK